MKSPGKSFIITVGKLLFAVFLYMLGTAIMGLAVFPAALLVHTVWDNIYGFSVTMRIFFVSLALATGYLVYGFSLITELGILRVVLRINLKEGEYRFASFGMMRWIFINALYSIVSITFMNSILLTPIAVVFFRFMGAKVGKNVRINSRYCADLALIEIGDNSVIGRNAMVIAHSFEHGRLILKKIKIGKNVVIGPNALVLSGVEIGDGASIAAGAVVASHKKVAAHTVYA